jgi:hypothetical protein
MVAIRARSLRSAENSPSALPSSALVANKSRKTDRLQSIASQRRLPLALMISR